MTTDTFTEITEGDWKTLATTEITHLTDEENDYLPRAWDEWIARVKRDAAREALAAAEHRATRAEARAEVRGRAVAIYRKRAEEAEVAARWAHDRAYKADLSWEDEKRRADQAEASRDEWRQTALDERGAALDTLEQIKVRDRRIQAVQHLVDQADHAGDWTVTCTHLQRAIDQ